MDNENKWEYDYSSEHSQTGETGYPNVGSSGMNTANTAGTYGEAAQTAPQAEPNSGSDGGAVPPPEGPRYQAAQGSPKQPPKKRRRKNGNIARIDSVLEAAPMQVQAVPQHPKDSSVTLRDVHFSYDGKTEVIKGVSLDIQPGQTVAFVGPSGGGKESGGKEAGCQESCFEERRITGLNVATGFTPTTCNSKVSFCAMLP